MGVAALAAGVMAAVLAGYPNPRRTMSLAGVFVLSAGALTAGVYAFEAARVGWSTLAFDSWLIVYTMPPEIATFNAEISGLAHPLKSVGRMGGPIYAGGWLENGDAFDKWSLAGWRTNGGVGVVMDTLIGPVMVAGSWGFDGRWRTYIGVGRIFR